MERVTNNVGRLCKDSWRHVGAALFSPASVTFNGVHTFPGLLPHYVYPAPTSFKVMYASNIV
jgi:hypothetical protein